MTEPPPLGSGTRAVHLPRAPVPAEHPVAPPVYRTATFQFETMTEYADVLADRTPGYVYSRIDNPTSDAFAAAVAMLEGAAAGQPFASGMAATSTVLLTLLSAGDHVVAHTELYGGTYSLLRSVLPRFGIETTFADASDLDAVRAALRPTSRLLWTETLANPTMTVADLPGLSDIAHDAGIPLVVDSTFASPALCRPLEWGADLVLHSATKYLGGHSDATGGVVVGAADVIARVRHMRGELGGMLAPDEAFLLHRGVQTLPLRVARHSASALTVASALAAHPKVAALSYPGLPQHPQHALAQRLFDRADGRPQYGGCLLLTPHGTRADGVALCDRLRLAEVVTSLGGTHTVVSHVASTTHRQLTDDELAGAGIGPASIRVSVGLEDPADLVADFTQALDSL